MLLVPKHEYENKLKHLRLNLSTSGSTSLTAPGTGRVFVPVYAWAIASALASIAITNGTGGSNLIQMKLVSGTYAEINFWEEPSLMAGNKAPVIVTEDGIGVSDIHVWFMTLRSGAGANSGAGNETALSGL
jgi:hypothetical protein